MSKGTERPSWFRGPGECHDKNGIPIHPGDLLRSYHFRGPRRRIYYLYHVACLHVHDESGHEYIRMVPAQYLDPSTKRDGGNAMLSDRIAASVEVISGGIIGDAILIHERPRKRKEVQ